MEQPLILVPMRNVVLFPGVVLPVTIKRERTVAGAQEALRTKARIGIVLQKDPTRDDPGVEDLHRVGTVASIHRFVTAADGAHHLICRGEQRFELQSLDSSGPYLVGRVRLHQEPVEFARDVEARATLLRERALEALALLPQVPAELAGSVQAMESPIELADLIASMIDADAERKQQILATFDLKERFDQVLALLSERIEVLKLSHDIGERTRAAIGQRQKEAVLREQLRQIRQELGEVEEGADELAALREAIANAKLPEEAAAPTQRELQRLERMAPNSLEASMARSYLETIAALPWAVLDAENLDIAHARQVLDADHFGLEKIKRRIVEFLAVRKMNPAGRSPILCFVGPPGVGKTSLGQSIARALGLKFARVSLGGVHDESEIRGHRRTYVGALPGNIIQALQRCGTRNPVLMLDEIDKLSASFHGDPAAALLEVLDPEQNHSFRDNYLGMPFDLSKVLFLCTANVLDTIPAALRDRLEIIELTSYTEEEKLAIAKAYLVPRQRLANGLTDAQVSLSDAALRGIIAGFTREAGCRNLERQIGAVLRASAVRVATGDPTPIEIGEGDLAGILGAPRFESEVALRVSVPGVATGLAWTPVGGDILFVEASRVRGNGKLILTGQLGDIMKESAQTALTLVKGQAARIGIDPASFDDSDIHIHVPAGAIPKDGPSAGVAMFTALASLFSQRRVRHDVAMTGEISLRGLVLPIGGVKEKCVAAARAGLQTVVLPARNRRDLEDVPEGARAKLRFVWAETVDDVLAAVLESGGSTEARAAA